MVFVTYVSLRYWWMSFLTRKKYDLRSAERARERMQGAEISGRPVSMNCHASIRSYHESLSAFQIDVHYSLPRDDHGAKGSDDKNNVLPYSMRLIVIRSFFAQATAGYSSSDSPKFAFRPADR